jgi:hypothetical protein
LYIAKPSPGSRHQLRAVSNPANGSPEWSPVRALFAEAKAKKYNKVIDESINQSETNSALFPKLQPVSYAILGYSLSIKNTGIIQRLPIEPKR